jgi:hypothetical protein
MSTLQVIEDRLVRDLRKRLVRALAAFHLRLLAHAAHPFVRARRSVSLLARTRVLPELGIDVVASSKQGAEQRHLLARRDGPQLSARQVGIVTRGLGVGRAQLSTELCQPPMDRFPLVLDGLQSRFFIRDGCFKRRSGTICHARL